MGENPGGKLKIIASVFFVLELIGSIIGAIAAMYEDVIIGIIILVAGVFVSYLMNVGMYAFGELVENSTIIASNITGYSLQANNASNNHLSKLEMSDAQVLASASQRNAYVSNNTMRNTNVPEFWTCSVCGKSNHRTVGTCGCGNRKVM